MCSKGYADLSGATTHDPLVTMNFILEHNVPWEMKIPRNSSAALKQAPRKTYRRARDHNDEEAYTSSSSDDSDGDGDNASDAAESEEDFDRGALDEEL